MSLHDMQRNLLQLLVVLLLLILCGCSAATSENSLDSLAKPRVVPVLSSPLISFAEHLSATDPKRNYVELLEIGSDALLSRIHLIRSARTSISLQTMIWANDETGRYLIYELIQAARRGVKVRLLIDHLASEQDVEIASYLAGVHPNFQIKFFNPLNGFFGQLKAEPSFLDKLYAVFFSFNRLNQRMHNKTFIIDGLIGITGGRNYQNAYYDQALGMNYKDRDLLVVGPAVAAMQKSFDGYWKFKRSISIGDLADVKRYQHKEHGNKWTTRESFQLGGLFDVMDVSANDPVLISQLLVHPLTAVERADFIADDPHKRDRSSSENSSRITRALAAMVTEAKESVYIQTPYLVLSSPAVELFRQVRKDNPQIDMRISTNSLAATDSWYVYALSYKQKKTYLSELDFRIYEIMPLPGDMRRFMPGFERLEARARQRVEALELGGKDAVPSFADETPGAGQDMLAFAPKSPYFCVHAKSLVVDDRVAFVGSYNLDPRSEKINTECGLVIRDAAFARRLKQAIVRDMQPQNSWVIAPKKRFIGIDETNAILVELSDMIPLIDPWPFRYASSFELRHGKAPVEPDDPAFYDNYRDVGSFPKVKIEESGKRIGAFGTKSFFSIVKPLL